MSKFSELKETALIGALSRCRLFQGLPSGEIGEIADITRAKAIDKGAYLFREGDPSLGFYIVQEGAINVHRVNPAGREQVIHIFRTGESFAEASLATDAGYPADARAEEASLALLVQKKGFIHLIARKPHLALRMLAGMAAHLRDLVGQIDDLKLKDVEARLANWLLKRCPDPNNPKPATVELEISKRVLASEIGTVSETLSRTMARLRTLNLIAVAGRTIVVLHPDKLKEFVGKRLGE